MARIKDVPRSEVEDERVQRLYERDLEKNGEIMNTTKILAHCPPILFQAKQFAQVLREESKIPHTLQALMNTLVARRNGCPF